MLQTRDGTGTRPPLEVVRQAIFNRIHEELKGARVLDLFAGSGSMGIEALSRGAGSCVMVENNGAALKSLRTNLETLELTERCEVLRGRLPGALEHPSLSGPFDIVLIDPPFDLIQKGAFLDLDEQCAPLLKDGGLVVNRLPERFPKLPPSPSLETEFERRYGISVVLVKRKGQQSCPAMENEP